MSANGKLYFVQESPVGKNGGAIKIGFTEQSVEKRIHQLQNGNPRYLVIHAVISGTVGDEMRIHAYFEADRVYGTREWFIATESVYEYVMSLPPYERPSSMQKNSNQRSLSGILTAKDDWRCNKHPGADFRLENSGKYKQQRRCCECLKEKRSKQGDKIKGQRNPDGIQCSRGIKIAAARLRIPLAIYYQGVQSGKRYCKYCKSWQDPASFKSRNAKCISCETESSVKFKLMIGKLKSV